MGHNVDELKLRQSGPTINIRLTSDHNLHCSAKDEFVNHIYFELELHMKEPLTTPPYNAKCYC